MIQRAVVVRWYDDLVDVEFTEKTEPLPRDDTIIAIRQFNAFIVGLYSPAKCSD